MLRISKWTKINHASVRTVLFLISSPDNKTLNNEEWCIEKHSYALIKVLDPDPLVFWHEDPDPEYTKKLNFTDPVKKRL